MKKRTIYIITSSIILLLLTGITSKQIIENRIEQTLIREIDQRTAGLYHLQIERTTFGLIKRSVTLKKVRLVADSSILISQGESHFISQIDLAQLKATKIDWHKNSSDLTLSCDQFILQDPIIHLYRNKRVDTNPDSQNTNRTYDINLNGIGSRMGLANGAPTAHQQSAHEFSRGNTQTNAQSKFNITRRTFTLANERISIGNFILNNGTLYEYETDGKSSNLHRTNDISFQAGTVIIDLSSDSANIHLSRRKLAADIAEIRYTLQDKDNQICLDSLYINTAKCLIRTVGLRMIPQLSQSDYAELSHNHGDWTQLEIATTVWSGVDFPALVKERSVSIDTIKIQGAKISSYKNRQVPQPQQEKQLLSQTIRELPIALWVGCIDFGPLDIIYQELSPEGTQPGTLTFQALTGQCLGLTNRPEAGASPMSIHLQGQYLEKAPLQADFHFPLQDSNDRFTVKGRLGTFDLQDLNPLTEPLANLEIQSGQVDSLLFTITGDATQSSVDLELLYHNLDVALIKMEAGKILQRRLLSEAIDDWILLPSNPQFGITRTGTGTVLRDPYKSQFNYLWRSLWPGLKSTLIRHRDRDRTHNKGRW